MEAIIKIFTIDVISQKPRTIWKEKVYVGNFNLCSCLQSLNVQSHCTDGVKCYICTRAGGYCDDTHHPVPTYKYQGLRLNNLGIWEN